MSDWRQKRDHLTALAAERAGTATVRTSAGLPIAESTERRSAPAGLMRPLLPNTNYTLNPRAFLYSLTPERIAAIFRDAATNIADQICLARDLEAWDDHLAGTLGLRRTAVLRLPATITCGDPDNPASVKAAELADKVLDTPWFKRLRSWLLRAIWHQHAAGEILWRNENSRWLPTGFRAVEPERWHFDDTKEPWFYAELWQSNANLIEPTAGRFVVHDYGAVYGQPGEYAVIQDCVKLVYLRSFALTDWGMRTDKHGQPFMHVQYAEGMSEEQIRGMITTLLTYAGNMVAATPANTTLNMLEVEAEGPHSPLIDFCTRALSKRLLGQDTAQSALEGQKTGSQIQSEVRSDIRDEDAELLDAALNETFFGPLCAWNFGPDTAAPRIRHAARQNRDPVQTATVIRSAAEIGLPVGKRWAYEALAIEEPKEDDELLSGSGNVGTWERGNGTEETPTTDAAVPVSLQPAQITSALDVLSRYREATLELAPATELLVGLGLERDTVIKMLAATPRGKKDSEADILFKRELIRAWLADGTISDVVYNRTDVDNVLAACNVPLDKDYVLPWLPVQTPAGGNVTGEVIKDDEGNVVGAIPEPPPAGPGAGFGIENSPQPTANNTKQSTGESSPIENAGPENETMSLGDTDSQRGIESPEESVDETRSTKAEAPANEEPAKTAARATSGNSYSIGSTDAQRGIAPRAECLTVCYSAEQPRDNNGQWINWTGTQDSPKSDAAAAVLEQWSTPAVGSRTGEYEKIRSAGAKWAEGGKHAGFERLYQETQTQLKTNKVSGITAYRGIELPHDHPLARAITNGRLKQGDNISVEGMSLTSWSTTRGVAEGYANSLTKRAARAAGQNRTIGLVLRRQAPAEDVVSASFVHKGFLGGENEAILRNPKGRKITVQIIAADVGGTQTGSRAEILAELYVIQEAISALAASAGTGSREPRAVSPGPETVGQAHPTSSLSVASADAPSRERSNNLQAAFAKRLNVVRQYVNSAGSLEAVRDRLAELFTQLDGGSADELANAVHLATFDEFAAGRLDTADKIQTQLAARAGLRHLSALTERRRFTEAIDQMAQRTDLLPKEEFLKLEGLNRSRSWTVARVADLDVLRDLHTAVGNAIEGGQSWREFKDSLDSIMEQRGWEGLRPWHARLVYEQNIEMARSAGRVTQARDAGVEYWRKLPSDSAVQRPEHAKYDGQIFRFDQKTPPPWAFGCKCNWEVVFADEVDPKERARLGGPSYKVPGGGEFEWDASHYYRPIEMRQGDYPEQLWPVIKSLASDVNALLKLRE